MNDEILNMMKNRRELRRNSEENETVHRMIRAKCKAAKELWLNESCREVENCHGKDLRSMYKKINDITGRRKVCSSTGCIKSKEGHIITGKEKILERWEEYIKELYGDNERNEHFRIRTNSEGPQILRSEVEHAIKRIKAPFTLYRFHTKTVQKCSVLAYRLHCTVFLSGIK